ncbi:MAG: hypothetical protein A2233_01695 [Candidatus Kerfeldbacteria bacterium RIFOXYA2_FULL_38_24]|uniref:Uncharacterized protein n=1 Tax=Candidatus Kerfeldbacteria bacterium RIFOXYB2_FULL_38_14 TaxID=1798547 RepID=A0A1G2BEQ8_9BACT|nr:MAG: hypothetical protein A2319_04305 [Candidatus Kerfeldbacteria bacterium RIFOXYB2_FULL_38_14]OGY87832.1 MAG: hypothetical protein A2233_01695 [Candidatus Kerfeldbacteria bacterium RIFOXYA2_FULL_38_24]OGY90539.1 MAG: hypothetical protein A2458_02120 [Candidatus Kerfeldbacteria bacterium RIFOXYC2_FULL_38_9]
MKKLKIVLIIVGIVIVVIFGVVYFSNSLAKSGLCRPGTKFMHGPFGEKFCYTPSGYEGKPCDKASDCGSGRCILVDENKTIGKGVCQDITYGCVRFADDNGSFDSMICLD